MPLSNEHASRQSTEEPPSTSTTSPEKTVVPDVSSNQVTNTPPHLASVHLPEPYENQSGNAGLPEIIAVEEDESRDYVSGVKLYLIVLGLSLSVLLVALVSCCYYSCIETQLTRYLRTTRFSPQYVLNPPKPTATCCRQAPTDNYRPSLPSPRSLTP